jgi:hypothetical protein
MYQNSVNIDTNWIGMNKLMFIAITVSVLFISGGTLATAASFNAPASSTLTTKDINNYSVSYMGNAGYIKNITYEGKITLSNSIYINGTSLSSSMQQHVVASFDNGTVSLFGKSNPASIGIMTGTTTSSNITMHLTEKATKLSTDYQTNSSEDMGFGGLGLSAFTDMKVSTLAIENGNYTGFIITNGKVSMVNNTLKVDNKYKSSISTNMPLFVMIATSGNIMNSLHKYESHKNAEKVNYNSTSGAAVGKYVSFNFNQSTNEISHFNNTMDGKNVNLFTSIFLSGNGTIGTGFNVPSFVLGKVQTYGSLFLYANESYITTIHDNPVTQSSFVIDNGSATFVAPSNSNITVFGTNGQKLKFNVSEASSNSQFQEKVMFGLNAKLKTGTTAIRISNNNTTEILMVDNATVHVSGETIKINTTGMGIVTLAVPPGMSHAGAFSSKINKAIQKGKISAQISINGTSQSGNFTVSYNSTVNTHIKSVSSGNAVLQISATPGHTKGTDITVFLSNSFLHGSSTVYLKFDGHITAITNVNNILNVTSSVNATYAVYAETGGELMIIHVPHFSNHTMEISTTPFTSISSTPTNYLIPIIGVVVVALILVGAAIYITRKK